MINSLTHIILNLGNCGGLACSTCKLSDSNNRCRVPFIPTLGLAQWDITKMNVALLIKSKNMLDKF